MWVFFVLRRKRRVSHLFVVEHSRESRSLVFEFLVPDEILYQEMKDCIVRGGNGAAHA
jgi:hypothetical protein